MNYQWINFLQGANDENRFKKDFKETEKIANGGFSSVFKALNKFDDQFYAVKKIKLKMRQIQSDFSGELEKVFREAKFLAKINHPHIIRYYNSWLEIKPVEIRCDASESTVKSPFQSSERNSSFSKKRMSPRTEEKNEELDDDSFELDLPSELDIVFKNDSEDESEKAAAKPSGRVLHKPVPLALEPPEDIASLRRAQLAKNLLGENSKTPQPMNCLDEYLKTIDTIYIYIQTELCRETLENYLQRRNLEVRRGVSEEVRNQFLEESFEIMQQLLNGLQYIHKNCQLIHRDLKPSNIFLSDNFQVKIGDFGLVKKFETINSNAIKKAKTGCFSASCKFLIENPKNRNPLGASDCNCKKWRISPDAKKRIQKPLPNELNESKEGGLLIAKRLGKENFSREKKSKRKNSHKERGLSTKLATRNCGTFVYASPEQINQNERTRLDQRADIYSLGIIILQIFHPMGTSMELLKTIANCKEGKFPPELSSSFPVIVSIIGKMVDVDPNKRPHLKEIIEVFRNERKIFRHKTSTSGWVSSKLENSSTWKLSWFKLLDNSIYLFNSKESEKAETFYPLKGCAVKLNEDEGLVVIEHPIQQNCWLKGETAQDSRNLYFLLNKDLMKTE